MIDRIKNKIIVLFQLILVIIFIVFEEVIWEGIAKPIYETIHSLKILQTLETQLQKMPAWFILILFVGLLIGVEMLGIYAGILFLSGDISLSILVYLMKIPIAAFTFWLFRATENKLMQFKWFRWLYEKFKDILAWIKSRQIYKETMERLSVVKVQMKEKVKILKRKYFSKESTFVRKVKRLYKIVKATLKK
ncbi:MAG: hypothetical protein DSZ12_02895 [Sulfurovum sp.]|nr:MAG: hypothetical protein DSZ12_02895 [Sulfurovum sp.]